MPRPMFAKAARPRSNRLLISGGLFETEDLNWKASIKVIYAWPSKEHALSDTREWSNTKQHVHLHPFLMTQLGCRTAAQVWIKWMIKSSFARLQPDPKRFICTPVQCANPKGRKTIHAREATKQEDPLSIWYIYFILSCDIKRERTLLPLSL